MDEDLEKQNKKLQEDPDDFSVKNHIFTQESMVSYQNNLMLTFPKLTLQQRQSVSNERFVEEIVRERTLQVFKTKCRSFDITSLEQ